MVELSLIEGAPDLDPCRGVEMESLIDCGEIHLNFPLRVHVNLDANWNW
jgi:hypothetical protein